MIEIVPYDEAWPRLFAAERDRLSAALGPIALRIEHNGSTAVPGLAAKPVIDIQVSVARLQPLDRYAPALQRLGYVHLPHADDAFAPFFHRPAGWPHTHHVHVVEAGSAEERRTLAFRVLSPRQRGGCARVRGAEADACREIRRKGRRSPRSVCDGEERVHRGRHRGSAESGPPIAESESYHHPMRVLGLHHVTATVDDAQDDLDFCLGALGLRLVKKTVNFDNHHVYHFYYGDERGTPGTIWTTFPYKGRGVRGRQKGAGQVTVHVVLGAGRLARLWQTRLREHGDRGHRRRAAIRRGGRSRFADRIGSRRSSWLPTDRDGRDAVDRRAASTRTTAIRGLHSVTMVVRDPAPDRRS